MTASVYETLNEKAISGAAALVMHILFFALLVVGVAWQKREAPPMVAELWSNLPAPKTEPPPPPQVEPKPVPKAEPKPVPKAEPKPILKADIALREKKEKELKAKELAEKKKREEQAQLEKLKAQQERERKEQLAREQDEALKKIAQSKAAEQARLVDQYKRLIADRIRSKINEPPGLKGNPEVEFDIIVIPGGDVLDVKLRRASGQALWDSAVERAIRNAPPLPLPPAETGLLREFRELNLRFRPKE